MIGYEIEYFSFFDITVLFSAGNVKKNVFTVFTVPIVTIDGFKQEGKDIQDEVKEVAICGKRLKLGVFIHREDSHAYRWLTILAGMSVVC